jgi:hypothetical protein
MILQDRPQPVREHNNLRDRGQSGVCPAVDLGEHGVENKIMELFLLRTWRYSAPGTTPRH